MKKLQQEKLKNIGNFICQISRDGSFVTWMVVTNSQKGRFFCIVGKHDTERTVPFAQNVNHFRNICSIIPNHSTGGHYGFFPVPVTT